MPAIVHVLPVWTNHRPGVNVSTVSKAKSGLSPFLLGPCELYKYTPPTKHIPNSYCMDSGYLYADNMENSWQYSKVYAEHLASDGSITNQYWEWATEGWANKKAVRYPMGKGRKPEFSLWDGERLGYVDARKAIYGPLYIEAVKKTKDFAELKKLYKTEAEITLLDYDAYDHIKFGMSLTDVLNHPGRKMGHAFVLAMLLTNDKALKQMKLRD